VVIFPSVLVSHTGECEAFCFQEGEYTEERFIGNVCDGLNTGYNVHVMRNESDDMCVNILKHVMNEWFADEIPTGPCEWFEIVFLAHD
jgi:hypothetical protein